MWDVFFFGTARRIDSQMSDTMPGMGTTIAGSIADCHLCQSGRRFVDLKVLCAIGRKAWRKDALGETRRAMIAWSEIAQMVR